jgi:hypothetical protein
VHADGVDDLFVVFDLRVFRGHGARRLQEEPVAELHDVRFMDRRDGVAALPPRVVERELGNPRRRPGRDDLQALDDAGYDLMLEAGIEILGVLADDHEIDVLEPSRDTRQIPDRPQIGVEVERLAQCDIHAREAFANRCGNRPLKCDTIAFDRDKEFLGQGLASFRHGGGAGIVTVPLDVDRGGRQYVHDGGCDFRTDAVPGYQRNDV